MAVAIGVIIALFLIMCVVLGLLYGVALTIRNTLSELLDAVRHGSGGHFTGRSGPYLPTSNATYLQLKGTNGGPDLGSGTVPEALRHRYDNPVPFPPPSGQLNPPGSEDPMRIGARRAARRWVVGYVLGVTGWPARQQTS